MIDYIKGELIQKRPTNIVLESNGIGYYIHISLHTFSNLPVEGDKNLKILTYLSIKEDSHSLYGFIDEIERLLFTHLISVSGIGTGTARMILSSMSPLEINQTIARGDIVSLQKIKGIGIKSAQRIILEIQDKVKKDTFSTMNYDVNHNTKAEEALRALMILGFARNLAQKALDKVISERPLESLALDSLIKMSLKYL